MHTCFHLPQRSTIKAVARGPTRVAISLSFSFPRRRRRRRHERVYENKSRRAPAITRGRLRRLLICLATHSYPFLSLFLFQPAKCADSRAQKLAFREYARKFTRDENDCAFERHARPLPSSGLVNPLGVESVRVFPPRKPLPRVFSSELEDLVFASRHLTIRQPLVAREPAAGIMR